MVRLTAAAEADFEDILRWTVGRFGEAQARIYAETLSAALNVLATGPTVVGARRRDDILRGIFTLHVARKGRHFVMFRVGRAPDREVIEVLRLLHDAMDLQRHLPPAEGGRFQGVRSSSSPTSLMRTPITRPRRLASPASAYTRAASSRCTPARKAHWSGHGMRARAREP
jgi:toxin ParE1/3/4